jgi:hypothetical protein
MHWKSALMEVIKERKISPVKVGDKVLVGDTRRVIVSTDWLRKIARIAPESNIDDSVEISFDILRLKDE